MSEEILRSLLKALEVSPDNEPLRAQVTRELLKARRWADAGRVAAPLMGSGHRPLALLAAARAALAEGDAHQAGRLYRLALDQDRTLVDEALEAELEDDATPLRLPVSGGPPMPPLEALPEPGPRLRFDDVGGMAALKEQIRLNILYPLQKPEIYRAYGKKVGGGILMYGPPGCGKTYLARATAGEIGASFYVLSLQEVLSMWVGETEKQLSSLFETARSTAPSVLFIDEVDALGARRSDIHSAPIRWMVSQFLMEMDGIAARNEKVLVLGATNAPWNVDPALRRPGRFDRVLFVPPPDAPARAEILRIHGADRRIDPALNWSEVAKKTELFSGADLAALVEHATELALADALKSGKVRNVTSRDFAKAVRGARPSTVEWLRRARNYVTFSNQDGFYDDLSRYLSEVRLR